MTESGVQEDLAGLTRAAGDGGPVAGGVIVCQLVCVCLLVSGP